ncbi:DUF2510 domain-containing protein [Rhodococcus sp. HNM0569]|uniref:DUF2510 domain-containing protein n=1 Tax=Rhodococcus sp. HNM0569 TaxID=2716340 RepID=UPI00146EC7DE|nr:DUF2510 domain-containing protein [Rhodococcus sp. HNM0569]
MTSPTRRIVLAAGTALVALATLTGCAAAGEAASDEAAAQSTSPATRTETPQQAEARRQAAAASAKAQQEAAAEAEAKRQAEEAAKRDPATYEQLTERDFALIAKNPNAAVGRKVVVYGRVTQFDAATGLGQFLARTSPFVPDSVYDYDQNTLIVGDSASLIQDVVEGDLVTMHAEVLGSFSYDTQAGGNTTVPKLQVNLIEVTGSA